MSATVRPDWLVRVFRALLICFPPPFRQRFGASMLAIFCEGLDRRRGVSGLRFAARAFAGLITSGIAERLAARRAGPSRLAATLERTLVAPLVEPPPHPSARQLVELVQPRVRRVRAGPSQRERDRAIGLLAHRDVRVAEFLDQATLEQRLEPIAAPLQPAS